MTEVFDWLAANPGVVFFNLLAFIGAAVLTAALTDRRNRP